MFSFMASQRSVVRGGGVAGDENVGVHYGHTTRGGGGGGLGRERGGGGEERGEVRYGQTVRGGGGGEEAGGGAGSPGLSSPAPALSLKRG